MTRLSLTAFAFAVLAVPAFAGTMSGPAAIATMTSHNGDAVRMTQALNALEAKGYGDFKDFHTDGAKFAATVTENGKPFTVIVNPDDGQVTRQS